MLYYLFEYLNKTLNISNGGSNTLLRSALFYFVVVCCLQFMEKELFFLQNQQVWEKPLES
jgi:hypothetical protein